MMKKFLSLVIALILTLSFACAEEKTQESVSVLVSITDQTGELVLALAPVNVTDVDGDGQLTINDGLMAAHAEYNEGGAEAYEAVASEYGMSMVKLWGAENGGSFGYYLNNGTAWSLLDPIQPGDHVKAFLYTDLETWSDLYCYFDTDRLEAEAGAEVSLSLYAATFDADYNPVSLPVAGAVILVDGQPSDRVTDAEGRAVLSFAEAGEYVISAESGTMNLVAPVCRVIVK